MSKRDGTSRLFGFIGYKTDEEAQKAKAWFDGSYFGTSRVKVEVVDGTKNAPAARPAKKRRVDESTASTTKSSNDVDNTEKPTEQTDKPALSKFMDVMKPRNNLQTWANEDLGSHLPTAASDAIPIVAQPEETPVEENNEGLSDLEWMKRRMQQGMSSVVEEKAFEQSDDEEDGVKASNPPLFESKVDEVAPDQTKQTILETGRLFIRNLPFSTTADELEQQFSSFGEISQVHFPLSAEHTPKGIAFVTFRQPSAALAAYESLDGTTFQGRLLHIIAAIDRRAKADDHLDPKKSIKDQKLDSRKKGALKESGARWEWGMLFMNADAVASSIADRLSISKADILNSDSDATNPAVKLALAETHIIQETRDYLASQGVHIASFSEKVKKSDTALLVKNIPYGTDASTLREMFGAQGEIMRLIIPPAGTIAVIEYTHPAEAQQAFKKLAYRRLGSSILYLERAPGNVFINPTPVDAAPQPTPKAPVISSAVAPITIPEDQQAASLAEGKTLFIKNLAFSTTSERLTSVFRHLPGFVFARVQTKPDPKRPDSDARLSMGYGFVGFDTTESAKKGLQSTQGFVLDGHALSVKFAGRGAEEEKKGVPKSQTTKMIVKNVPFEASKKDIRELFGAHGHLKSVRLPKKFDSRSRGFAFLDFLTRREAENAYAALKHTHLLGRHLVLEWAEETEQDIDKLREKVGVGFGNGKALPGRKRKLQLENEVDGFDED
ncbi:hypothetical protein SISNIDRAFT_451955 [Sistotremastrum niveocremeum HHB9708]|uniref:RRM domain-containing protein n=1 Tax=Sistotremastrum niveocremeum HHB9708 TaxID=1314777 RepID=A0A164WUE9_9AGAM|nr:hypothetical protein SISNIDRAFT_451955 [Sistotremastrum niveocremeum HHB9708]